MTQSSIIQLMKPNGGVMIKTMLRGLRNGSKKKVGTGGIIWNYNTSTPYQHWELSQVIQAVEWVEKPPVVNIKSYKTRRITTGDTRWERQSFNYDNNFCMQKSF